MESLDVYSSDIESVMQSSHKNVYKNILNRVDTMYQCNQPAALKPKNQFAMRQRKKDKSNELALHMNNRSSKRYKEDNDPKVISKRGELSNKSMSLKSLDLSESISVKSQQESKSLSYSPKIKVKIDPKVRNQMLTSEEEMSPLKYHKTASFGV